MKKRLFACLLTAILVFAASAQCCISFAGTDTTAYKVTLDGKSLPVSGYYVKGNVYLPASTVGTYFVNPHVTVNDKNTKLILDTANMNILMADDTVTDLIGTYCGEAYIPLVTVDSKTGKCFSMNVASKLFDIEYSVSGNTIRLRTYSGTEKIARVKDGGTSAVSSLFSSGDRNVNLAGGERVFIDGETDSYYRISDFDGNCYYVAKNAVEISDVDLSFFDIYAPKKSKYAPAAGRKINLAWQYVSSSTPEAPAPIGGIDIMAPTWFRLNVEDGGSTTNSGDRGYTDLCHKNGFKVWATITNNMSETGSTNFTGKMFETPEIQKRAIAQYILYACLYDVDGINIDFEDLKDSYREGLVAFTSEMRTYTERQGLNLSIDVSVPSSWSTEYDNASLSKYVDYIAVMSYDEHYGGSKVPGSVSSLPFTQKAVKDMLSDGVPASKLLMGIPLYTREWVVDENDNLVSNTAVTMSKMQQILAEKNPQISFLTRIMQNYVEYPVQNGTAQVWLEDATSIRNRLELASSYDVAGTACWQYSQATSDIWQLFDEYLH